MTSATSAMNKSNGNVYVYFTPKIFLRECSFNLVYKYVEKAVSQNSTMTNSPL